jgi:hypothetical protein
MFCLLTRASYAELVTAMLVDKRNWPATQAINFYISIILLLLYYYYISVVLLILRKKFIWLAGIGNTACLKGKI